MTGTYTELCRRVRRAVLNKRGLHITAEAAQALIKSEIYEILCKLEAEEMRAELETAQQTRRHSLDDQSQRDMRVVGGSSSLTQGQEEDAKAASDAARQRAKRIFD